MPGVANVDGAIADIAVKNVGRSRGKTSPPSFRPVVTSQASMMRGRDVDMEVGLQPHFGGWGGTPGLGRLLSVET